MVTIGVVLTAAAGGWTLFQTQLASMERQFTQSIRAISDEISQAKQLGERNRDDTIHRAEHAELVKRLDGEFTIIRDQLRVIETTRPTTGELQAVATAGARDLAEIKERVRSLEDNLRKPQPLGPITVQPALPGNNR